MPTRRTATKAQTHQAMKNASYESRLVSWLMQDGWQIFTPILDYGHQTDILISDGPNYYRIQVKTVEVKNGQTVIENRWKDSQVDIVVYFARNSTYGYITPAFSENRRHLNADSHMRFEKNKKSFLKAFHLFK